MKFDLICVCFSDRFFENVNELLMQKAITIERSTIIRFFGTCTLNAFKAICLEDV
jgi:hypothetical protein